MKAVQLINTNANTPVVITKGKAMAAIGSAQFKGPLCAVSSVTAMLVCDPLAASEDAQQHLADGRWNSLDCSFGLTVINGSSINVRPSLRS